MKYIKLIPMLFLMACLPNFQFRYDGKFKNKSLYEVRCELYSKDGHLDRQSCNYITMVNVCHNHTFKMLYPPLSEESTYTWIQCEE